MAGLRTLDGRGDDHDLGRRYRMSHRIENTAKVSTRGNLRIGDHWNAITIIALSQNARISGSYFTTRKIPRASWNASWTNRGSSTCANTSV